MKSYSPYENVPASSYPPILAITSLNDTRVLYREPAKWVARLRAAAKGGPFLLKTRDGGRARRPQRPLRRVAGGSAGHRLDHRHRGRPGQGDRGRGQGSNSALTDSPS